MPETRYLQEVSYPPGLPVEDRTPDNAVITQVPYEVSDAELAEEQDRQVLERAEDLIDGIVSLAGARAFLKVLVKRLIKNGALP